MSPAAALILYAIFALGGVGLYFAMPRLQRQTAKVGAILGLAAVVGLVAFFAAGLAGPALPSWPASRSTSPRRSTRPTS